jgi:hypothetical protein
VKLKRSILVKDGAGKSYTIREYTNTASTTAFKELDIDSEEPATLSLNGRHVNNLGDGRYEVVGTGTILYEVDRHLTF